MSESDTQEIVPTDLIPLGVVHNDERREDLIGVVNASKRKRTITLWAYKGHHSAELRRVPDGYELNWMGGPGREEGNHPDHPGLAYYCDVTAEIRLRADTPDGYVLHAGAADAAVFTQVQISEAALTQLRAVVYQATAAGPKSQDQSGGKLATTASPPVQPPRREVRRQKKREMYDTWSHLAIEHCVTDNGQRRTRAQIANKIAHDERAKDPFSGKLPARDSVIKRLDQFYPGWTEKSWTERTSRKNLSSTSVQHNVLI
jgi:hypothetical protein